jgi:nucleoside-diphosphate-sugar epimerase
MAQSLRIVVTGGSGKIGTRLLQTLMARGHQPLDLDRDMPTNRVAPFVQADLRERTMLEPIFDKADAVCHLGELPGLSADISPDKLFSHNCAVGARVLQTAVDMKVKHIVYVSSCQVYGLWGEGFADVQPPASLPLDENTPLHPRNTYALAKVAIESYARLLAEQNPDFTISVIRLPAIWDDRDVQNAQVQLPEVLQLREGFNTYLHLDDAASILALALENQRPGFEAYHAVAEEVWSAKPVRELLKERFGDSVKLPPDWPDFKAPVSTEKTRKHFGWSPRFKLNALR